MSFILSCDFWFCCCGASDPECQPPPPYARPTHPQTQVVTVLQPPGQIPPRDHISPNQLPPLLPAPALPPTIVYNLQPPGKTPSPHVPNSKEYYLPPLNWEQRPPWPSAPPSRVPSSFKECTMPQPVTQQPLCHSILPSKAFDPLPKSTQTIPSHVPSNKVREPAMSRPAPQADHSPIHPSNTYQMPSITNQHEAPPKAPQKREETRTPSKVHNPLQKSNKQRVLHTNVCDEPTPSHITSQPPPQAVWPTRQPSKTNQNVPSMNQQQSIPPNAPSKWYETLVPAVAPTHARPLVPPKIYDPLPPSKKTVLSSVPSTKARDEPPPAKFSSQPPPQVEWLARQPSKTYQKLPTIDQHVPPPAQLSSQPPAQVEWLARQPSKTYQKSPTMDQHVSPPAQVSTQATPQAEHLAREPSKTYQKSPAMDQHVPPPAQVSSQPLPQAEWSAHQPPKTYQKSHHPMDQQLAPPHALSKRYETPMQAVAQMESSKDAKVSMENYSGVH